MPSGVTREGGHGPASGGGTVGTSGILAIDQYAVLGGGQRLLLDVIRDQVSTGTAVTLALPDEGPVSEAARAMGAETVTYDLSSLPAGSKPAGSLFRYLRESWLAAGQLASVAKARSVSLLYVNGPRCLLPSVLAARRCGLPVVAAIHLIHDRWLERRLLTTCMQSETVKAVTFCSQFALEPFKASIGSKGRVLWNWVSDDFLSRPSGRAASRDRMGLSDEDVVVGVLGRLSRNKGQAELVLGLRGVLRAKPNVHLAIAGGTDFENPCFEEELKRLVRDSSLERQILFLGPVSDSIGFLDALDVLVVPSQWEEPFGLVAIEGMARSLPVVATKSGGLDEIIDDRATGLLVSKDPESLGLAISALIEDPASRERMGASGRMRVERLFQSRERLAELRKVLLQAGLAGPVTE